jgi:hypothetical protein
MYSCRQKRKTQRATGAAAPPAPPSSGVPGHSMCIWLVSKCVTFVIRWQGAKTYSRFWDICLPKFMPFPYDNNSLAYYKNIINIWTRARTETCAWNETAPEPRENKRANISKHIRSYVFVAWFPDLSVAIRICILACLYNLKANRNQFTDLASILKYIWLSKMIVQNVHSLQSKCEVRKWKHVIWDFSILLLGYQFFMGHVTSSDQGFSSTRGKSLGTRLVT